MRKLLSILALTFGLSACASSNSHLSVIVPEGAGFTVADLNRATVKKNVSGESWRPILFIVPLGFPSFESAVQEALYKGNGTAMTNVTITEETSWFVLFGSNKITVSGDVVNTRN